MTADAVKTNLSEFGCDSHKHMPTADGYSGIGQQVNKQTNHFLTDIRMPVALEFFGGSNSFFSFCQADEKSRKTHKKHI